MPKTREEKKEILKKIEDKLKQAKSVIFSSDTGSTVKVSEALRNELKANDAEYLIAKKTLLKKALKDLPEVDQLDELKGSVGVTVSYGDEVIGAKILNKFAKDSETLELGGGILEGQFILAEKVKRLASLPSREELLAKLVGSLNSPMSGMVSVLSGTTRNFVGVLNAIKEKKQ